MILVLGIMTAGYPWSVASARAEAPALPPGTNPVSLSN
jgi:hypothetical protein